jgi:hypothetical protein
MSSTAADLSNKQMVPTKNISIPGRNDFKCRTNFTVNKAIKLIRDGFGFQFGYLLDEEGACDESQLIGETEGNLTYVEGQIVQPANQPGKKINIYHT